MASFFRTQKLLVQVLPDADEATQQLQLAANCDGKAAWVPSFLSSLGAKGIELDASEFDPSASATYLLLKAQLKEALALVEAKEQALHENLRPQTLEEAQALETYLTSALAEVGKQKEALQHKADEDTGEPNG